MKLIIAIIIVLFILFILQSSKGNTRSKYIDNSKVVIHKLSKNDNIHLRTPTYFIDAQYRQYRFS